MSSWYGKVGDGERLRITDVEAMILEGPEPYRAPEDAEEAPGVRHLCLIKVSTDAGLVGWADVETQPHVAKAIVEAPASGSGMFEGLRELAVGEDPFEVELVAAAREAVGDRVELMVDAGWLVRRTSKEAAAMVRRLEPYRPYWIEEPLAPDDYDGYRMLAEAVATPIAAGEQEATLWGFDTLIHRGRVDILQPDLSRCGGFTVARKIADLAELRSVAVCRQAWLPALLTAASLHLNAYWS